MKSLVACVALTPCFNLDAPKPIQFFTDTTSLSLGTLPMYQFKRLKNNESMFRTKHSMHSYIGEGQTSEKRYLVETIWKFSFGKSSFFEHLDSRKVLWLNLGCKGGVGAYSLIHHAESLSSVPYRKNLLLDSYIDGLFCQFPYYAKVVEANFDRSPLVLSKEYDESCLLKVSGSNGSNICLHRYSDLMEICLSAITRDPFCFYPESRSLLND